MNTIKRVRKYQGNSSVGEKVKLGKRCYKVVKGLKSINCNYYDQQIKKIISIREKRKISYDKKKKLIEEKEKLKNKLKKGYKRNERDELHKKLRETQNEIGLLNYYDSGLAEKERIIMRRINRDKLTEKQKLKLKTNAKFLI